MIMINYYFKKSQIYFINWNDYIFRLIKIFLSLLFWLFASNALSQAYQIDEMIRQRIEAAGVVPDIVIGNDNVLASTMLPQFYERRTFQPAWCNAKDRYQLVQDLVVAVRDATSEGLRPEDYHTIQIEAILMDIQQNRKFGWQIDPGRLVDLELLCTDAFLVNSEHLLSGKVNPETIETDWLANRRETDLVRVLEEAVLNKQIRKYLQSLLPNHSGYTHLRKLLSNYRQILTKGGWNFVPNGEKLQRGDSGERVITLRRGLNTLGIEGIRVDPDDSDFDEALENAVCLFQRMHGINADGVVGPATLSELNVPVEDRIRQIKANMERWRWLPQNLGKKYILVNIANFELDLVENNHIQMNMKVITGKPYRRTPVFSDIMTYLVFNPYWHVPTTIAKQDLLPAIRQNVNYLFEKKIRVFMGWEAGDQEVDPLTVNWDLVSASNLPYRFRQDPGPQNALGCVKFMFPNKFDVYLHDTPSRELFSKTERAFSSGCIRIENPVALAEHLLRGDPRWTRKQIIATINSGVEETVRLPEPIPIHLLYWTTWADEDGTVQFRKDIYGRDKRLLKALGETPPHADVNR